MYNFGNLYKKIYASKKLYIFLDALSILFHFFYCYRICWVKNCFKYPNYMRYKKITAVFYNNDYFKIFQKIKEL